MRLIASILNLPRTLIGLWLAVLSGPKEVRFRINQFVVIINVKRLWLIEIFMKCGISGFTAGSVILLSEKAGEFTCDHEFIHIKQFRKMPFIFPALYYFESYRYGYRKNRYEEEAYCCGKQGGVNRKKSQNFPVD